MLRKSKKESPPGDQNITPERDVIAEEQAESSDQNPAPDSAEAGTANADADAGSEQPASAEDKIAKITNQYVRLMADFDNYRKRQAREREDFVKRSNERLLGDILPVVDNLELALKKVNNPEDPFATGVRLVYEQFQGVLKRCGLTPIEAHGQVFNPELHEALSYVSSPTVPANMVIDQFRCGWELTGHLMRAAQVIVSSGQPAEDADQENVSD